MSASHRRRTPEPEFFYARVAPVDRLGEPDEVALAVEEERAELAGALAWVVVGGGNRVATDFEAMHLEALARKGSAGRPARLPTGSSPSLSR